MRNPTENFGVGFDSDTCERFCLAFDKQLDELGFNATLRSSLLFSIRASLIDGPNFDKIHDLLLRSGVRDAWNESLKANRSSQIACALRPHLHGEVIDVLCGDASVSMKLIDAVDSIVLTERFGVSVDAEFVIHDDADEVLTGRVFDIALLSTVLHHERNPEALYRWAAKRAKRVVVVENVIDNSNPLGYQILVDLFFNHGLNRSGADSPGTHRTVAGWRELFCSNGKIVTECALPPISGIPLSHHLFVVDLKAPVHGVA